MVAFSCRLSQLEKAANCEPNFISCLHGHVVYTQKIYHLYRLSQIVGGEVDMHIAQKYPVVAGTIFLIGVGVSFSASLLHLDKLIKMSNVCSHGNGRRK